VHEHEIQVFLGHLADTEANRRALWRFGLPRALLHGPQRGERLTPCKLCERDIWVSSLNYSMARTSNRGMVCPVCVKLLEHVGYPVEFRRTSLTPF
jgi:hypothetical protein